MEFLKENLNWKFYILNPKRRFKLNSHSRNPEDLKKLLSGVSITALGSMRSPFGTLKQ